MIEQIYIVHSSFIKMMSLLQSRYTKRLQLYGCTIFNDEGLPRSDHHQDLTNLSTSSCASLGKWWSITHIYFDKYSIALMISKKRHCSYDALLVHAMQIIESPDSTCKHIFTSFNPSIMARLSTLFESLILDGP